MTEQVPSDQCYAAGCKQAAMAGSVLCQEHHDKLPAPMRGEQPTSETLTNEPARKTEAEIQKLLDKVCKYMEKTSKGLCTDDWIELCELVEYQARNYIEAAEQDDE